LSVGTRARELRISCVKPNRNVTLASDSVNKGRVLHEEESRYIISKRL